MDEAVLKARIEKLLSLQPSSGGSNEVVRTGNELYQGALSIMTSVYGPESPHVTSLREVATPVLRNVANSPFLMKELIYATRGALENFKEELEAGLVGSLRQRLTGEVLTDLLQLARNVLEDPSDKAKNVASVLTAAAFEDTIRRMGASFAGVVGRDDLQDVISSLKQSGILQSPQLGIALSYLNFRNHALHAEWDKIDRASVSSVLAFVEQLLLKHF